MREEFEPGLVAFRFTQRLEEAAAAVVAAAAGLSADLGAARRSAA